MENKFLCYDDLKIYDEKLKQYIQAQIDKVINISLFGDNGFSLTGQGDSGTPIWAQNAGYRLCEDLGSETIKTVYSANWAPENGGLFAIKFLYAHTGNENAKMSINGVIASMFWESGEPITSNNTWKNEETVVVYYDGNAYIVMKKSPQAESLNAYPIGSIYISTVATPPATLFGGTWEQIKDTFLLTAGDVYSAGATGGEATHTLTIEEMPEHSHVETVDGENAVNGSATGENGTGVYITYTGENEQNNLNMTSNVGGGEAFNLLPPYLVVYAWKRTA